MSTTDNLDRDQHAKAMARGNDHISTVVAINVMACVKSLPGSDEWAQVAAIIGTLVQRDLFRTFPGLADVLEGKAVIVPVEATPEMRQAGKDVWWNGHNTEKVYDAMLAANPYRSTET
jgi:hypothetical protein